MDTLDASERCGLCKIAPEKDLELKMINRLCGKLHMKQWEEIAENPEYRH